MIKSIWDNRGLALRLAKNDIKNKFAGSYLGIVWAFIQPIVTVFVYWMIFEVGFKSGDSSQLPCKEGCIQYRYSSAGKGYICTFYTYIFPVPGNYHISLLRIYSGSMHSPASVLYDLQHRTAAGTYTFYISNHSIF